METKKYKLTDDTIIVDGHELHRIQALIDFSDVKCGDVGGYIESEDNLSQYENCWVGGNAKVYGYAEVFGNAQVLENAKVFGNAKVYDDAKIYGNAQVYGNAFVCDYAEVCGNAKIYGNAIICDITDYIVFKNNWSSGRYFTWTKSNNMWKVGCFYGTGEELIKKAYADSEVSGRNYEKYVKFVESLNQ